MSVSRYLYAINILTALLTIGLIAYGTISLFAVSYIGIFIVTVVRTFITSASKRTKLSLILAYTTVLVIQLMININVVFIENVSAFGAIIRKVFGILAMMLPIIVSRYVTVGKYSKFYLLSIQEAATLSFAQVNDYSDRIIDMANAVAKAGKSLSQYNIKEIIKDLPRHDSFNYINNGSLTDEYFEQANKSLYDENIYIVISNTGSPASELISIFTQKQYNHASLSFDKELKTIISYNGGERVYPPGLNHEMIEFFNKKKDASILVYKLPCTREQKQTIIDNVYNINKEGNAYNIMGLVFKYSHKPNIMFCSQFVYKMLLIAKLNYLDTENDKIQPTDLVELDYHRHLQFSYEILLNK